ncbi:MAG: hypothetical protein R2865_01430 [Deinococcales bacterium]
MFLLIMISLVALSFTMQAALAHAAGTTGEGVYVVVLDSGFDEDDSYDCPDTTFKETHGSMIRDLLAILSPDATIISKKIFQDSVDTYVLASNIRIIQALYEMIMGLLSLGHKAIVNISASGAQHPYLPVDIKLLWKVLNDLNQRYPDQLTVVVSAGNHGIADTPEKQQKVYMPGLLAFDSSLGNAISNIVVIGSAAQKDGRILTAAQP